MTRPDDVGPKVTLSPHEKAIAAALVETVPAPRCRGGLDGSRCNSLAVSAAVTECGHVFEVCAAHYHALAQLLFAGSTLSCSGTGHEAGRVTSIRWVNL